MSVFGSLNVGGTEFGSGQSVTLREAMAMSKAAYAGYDNGVAGIAGAGNMGPTRPQQLDNILHIVTAKARTLRMWPLIRKGPAFSVNAEFNRMTSFGNEKVGIWQTEGAIGEEVDTTYERVISKIRYASVTGRVTLPALMTKSAHGSLIMQEVANKTMQLLTVLEPDLYDGNSALDGKQIDGIFTQVLAGAPNNVIDCHGGALTQPFLDDALLFNSDAPNYGMASTMHLAPRAKASFVKGFYPTQRSDLFNMPQNGTIGGSIGAFRPASGSDISLVENIWIKDGGPAPTTPQGVEGKRPLAPIVSTAAAFGADATVSNFKADDAGIYRYWVTARNGGGESEATSVGVATAVAGDSATFICRPGAGSQPVDYYIVYRTKIGDSATATSGVAAAAGYARRILRVANANGYGVQTIKDVNAYMPGCTIGYIMQMDEIIALQLAPMLRLVLGQSDFTVKWSQLLTLVIQVLAPTHMVMVKNIATLPDTLSQVA